jgi:hypothetical protein
MACVGGVFLVGPTFVIEVMEQGGKGPGFFVSAGLAGVGAYAGLDREHVFA